MKFIKYAIGLVIALSVIPLVVVAVTKLDEPRLKTVEFEVVDVDDDTFTFSENTYNDIHTLAISDVNGDVTNLITVKLNGIELEGFNFIIFDNEYIYTDNLTYEWELTELNQVTSTGLYQVTIGDKWSMTFEVPNPTPPLVKLLVGFVPLLFVGGILLFMLNKRKFE